MTTIELVEHARPVSLPIDTATGRALAVSRIITATPDPDHPGHWLLKASSKVGAVTLSVPGSAPTLLRITPKLRITRLFFLLGYTLDPKGWQDDLVELAEQEELLPAVAHAFERLLHVALRTGPLKGYRATDESSLVVRGRIREGDQIRRHHGTMLPLEITYDEFTVDTAENRLLRTATERVLRLPGVAPAVRRRLLHQQARLTDATRLVPGRTLPDWKPTRLNAHYQPALRLATAILRGGSVEHRTGDVRTSGFLFDMNKLFEDFTTVALREALRDSDGYCRLQPHHHLDDLGAIRIRPDFVHYGHDGTPRGVADAKYKAERPAGYPDADLYQMLAYCTTLGLTEGHLVYAKGSAQRASHRVRHAGVTIHQHALDLEQPPAELLAEIAAIARYLRPAVGASARIPASRRGQQTLAANLRTASPDPPA
ncbi:McrC family protein [Kitasatospora sp. NPDC127059]|uniref:McrC family protein n=1 Tax=unclassified Kitasatospora TaxID=2633591 RepID=UPI0036638498